MRKTFFWKENLKLLNFFRKMSHSAEKCKRGTLWDLLTYLQLQNMKKLEEISKKSRTVPKKIERGTLLVPSGFVGYLEKVKNESGEPLD